MFKPDPEFIGVGEAVARLVAAGYNAKLNPQGTRIIHSKVTDEVNVHGLMTVHEGGWVDGRRVAHKEARA